MTPTLYTVITDFVTEWPHATQVQREQMVAGLSAHPPIVTAWIMHRLMGRGDAGAFMDLLERSTR